MANVELNSERWLNLENLPSEEWRNIEGYEGLYKVSNYGRIKSLIRPWVTKEHILRVLYDKDGYLYIHLNKHNHLKTYKIHRLVAQAFISNPHNLPEINHKDENKTNNYINNLEWCLREYNQNYGTRAIRSQNKHCKTILQYNKQGDLIKEHRSATDIHKELGYSKSGLSYGIKHNKGLFKGFIWKYKEEEYE